MSRNRKGRYQPPSIERLRELFELRGGVLYDRRTDRPAKTWKFDKQGYHRLAVDGCQVRVHRLIVAIRDGEWPLVVHHLDGDPSNNHADNLIAVDYAHNVRARGAARNSPTGRTGIRITKSGHFFAGLLRQPSKTFANWADADRYVSEQEKALGWPPRPWKRVTFLQAMRRKLPLLMSMGWLDLLERDDD